MNKEEYGYVKLFRKFTEWEWYKDANTMRLFCHLILMSNHKQKKWQGITIKRGQILTSYAKLAEQLGLSPQKIRTAINKLKSTNDITIKSTNKNTVISLCNYSIYQTRKTDEQQANQQAEQQSNNKQITTNKNEKNEKNPPNPPRGGVKKWVVEDINENILQRARSFAPGWDIKELALRYIESINSKLRKPPGRLDKAFPVWCQNYTKGKVL